jgi:ferredoxin-thioredoxin reductase catalytic subunit
MNRIETTSMNTACDTNLQRLIAIARKHGLVFNPDSARVTKGIGLMTGKHLAVGEYICPCKQQHKPARKGMDKTCPCAEWLEEIAQDERSTIHPRNCAGLAVHTGDRKPGRRQSSQTSF